MSGFNSIFTVSSIDVAKKYYAEFKKQLKGLPGDRQLKVATIFSFGVNEGEVDGVLMKTLKIPVVWMPVHEIF